MFVEILAFIATGLFAGAALYISMVEHPARMGLGTAIALAEFRPSYKRAAIMQATLAVIGASAAIGAYFLGRGISTLVAGIVLGTVVPFTLIAIMRTTLQLLDETRTATTADTDLLLRKWGRLHNVRTIASMLALFMLGANILGFI